MDSESFAVTVHTLVDEVRGVSASQLQNLRGNLRSDHSRDVDSGDFNFTSCGSLARNSYRGVPDTSFHIPTILTSWRFCFGFAQGEKFELRAVITWRIARRVDRRD